MDSPFRPELVITQPDRPRGRGQRSVFSPVKEVASRSGMRICQPERFNSQETWDLLSEIHPDLAVVVAYSAKIGKRALESVPEGWLNLHPSLLPAYRGAAPLQWALMQGERETGLTTFFLNEAWDAGPVCFQKQVSILPDESYGELASRCAVEGAELVLRSVEAVAHGQAPRIPQDDSRASFAPLIKPEDSLLDWSQAARDIHHRARGLTPLPGLFATWQGKRVQIEKTALPADPCRVPVEAVPGEVVIAGKPGLRVRTGDEDIEILRIRPENKSSMSGRDFVNGFRLKAGDRLGGAAPEE
jgi:methionyl-tRNA formyltransferase